MLDELLLPAELQLSIQRIEATERAITICIGCTKETAVCPDCGTESDRVNSVYDRYPTDLPLAGQVVRLCAGVRRFFCDNRSCARRTFAEVSNASVSCPPPRRRRIQRS